MTVSVPIGAHFAKVYDPFAPTPTAAAAPSVWLAVKAESQNYPNGPVVQLPG